MLILPLCSWILSEKSDSLTPWMLTTRIPPEGFPPWNKRIAGKERYSEALCAFLFWPSNNKYGMTITHISVRGARQHNLRDINVRIPRNTLTVVTGLSGSGKSSLAFDTIYAEGQRRYVETLSAYARQFLDQMERPDVDAIEGLSPAISIEQKTTSRSPRSTVGTITEIYDYLRLLYASVGKPHCPNCGQADCAADGGPDCAADCGARRRASGSR